jgi:hypothetical protein
MSEVDAALRQVSRRFPDALARALTKPTATVRDARWIETQLSSRRRSLDRALEVAVDGRTIVHHVEWAWRWRRTLPYRIFEYHTMLAMALHADRKHLAPPIESTLVLLSGRERPWPTLARHATSPREEPFSGVHFRVDAVYQQKVSSLRARGSELWLAFAPLAVDADARGLSSVARELTERVTDEDRLADLAAAMVVLAENDARRRGLDAAVATFFPKELVMRNSIYTAGKAAGRAEGLDLGRAEGLDLGLTRGRAEGLRTAVVVLCEAYGVALDDTRARWLADASADALDAALAKLRATRAWPL